MSLQYSTTLRNGELNTFNTALGGSALLKIFTGSVPANCAASEAGTLLVSFALAGSPFASASSGAISLGATSTTAAGATGTAGHFRILDGSAVCHMQGTITVTGGGGDATIDNTSITNGQNVSITSFAITAGGA